MTNDTLTTTTAATHTPLHYCWTRHHQHHSLKQQQNLQEETRLLEHTTTNTTHTCGQIQTSDILPLEPATTYKTVRKLLFIETPPPICSPAVV